MKEKKGRGRVSSDIMEHWWNFLENKRRHFSKDNPTQEKPFSKWLIFPKTSGKSKSLWKYKCRNWKRLSVFGYVESSTFVSIFMRLCFQRRGVKNCLSSNTDFMHGLKAGLLWARYLASLLLLIITHLHYSNRSLFASTSFFDTQKNCVLSFRCLAQGSWFYI